MDTNGSKKPPLKITGADGQPIEIEPGAYYVNPKARCQRIMREQLSPEAGRVHACLELATMGWHQELAVKLERGKKIPLTPDVCQQTGLSRQHTRRAIAELENKGLAERRSKDGGSLRRGQILLYSWALPRDNPKKVCSQRAATNSDGLPSQFHPLVILSKRLRIKIDFSDENVRETITRDGEQIARNLHESEFVAARFLKSICAQSEKPVHIRKKDRKDRTTKDTPPPPTSCSIAAPKAEEEEERPVSFEAFRKNYPPTRLDQAKSRALFDALSPSERQASIRWLEQHRTCPRWVDSAGRWIPLASTFLREKQFLHPPPPSFDTAAPRVETNGLSKLDQKAADFARRYREELDRKEKSRGS